MIPDTVMDELVMPLALARFEIQRNQAFPEEIVSGTRPSVKVARGLFDADVDDSSILVDRALSPGACIASVRPGILQPRVESSFARFRDRVKNPLALACADVVASHISFDIRLAGGNAARLMRGADDDRIPADCGS